MRHLILIVLLALSMLAGPSAALAEDKAKPTPCVRDKLALAGESTAKSEGDTDALPDLPPCGPENLFETDLPKTQFNYEMDISLRPNASDALKKDYIRSPVKLKYGLTDNWEVALEPMTYFDNFLRGEYGLFMSDAALATKYHLGIIKGIDTAVAMKAVFPVRYDPRISDGYYHYMPTLLVGKKLKLFRPVHTGLSIGTNFVKGPGPPGTITPRDTLNISMGGSYTIEKVSYSLETVYVTDHIDGGTMESLHITPGIKVDVNDWFRDNSIPGRWSFGMGVRLGLMDAPSEVEFLVRLKLHLRFDYKVDFKEMKLKKRA